MDPEQAIQYALDNGARFAEIRQEQIQEERITLVDLAVKDHIRGARSGHAVRILVGNAWGFVSSSDETTLRRDVDAAITLAKATPAHEEVNLADSPTRKERMIWQPKVKPEDVDVSDKVALLKDMANEVLAFDEIDQADGSYAHTILRKQFFDSDGADLEWGLTRSVGQVHFTAHGNGQMSARSSRVGGTRGFELFDIEDPIAKAKKAGAAAVEALGAKSLKGGKRTVVIDHELAGVFAHEAVGHAAEADLVTAGESLFKDRLGERVGIEGLHIHDTSLLEGSFGSFPIDDNGVLGQDRQILQDGVLVGYLSDRQNAAKLGIAPNGSARAQDHDSRPLVRMSNTLIDPGEHTTEEIFDIKDGVYCRGSRGGQVDTARGTFLFNAMDAYIIKDGELTTPLRDVSLTGDMLGTLHNISGLGNEFKLGDPGHCGKGQWVPVCDGGPLVRIEQCLVGGGA